MFDSADSRLFRFNEAPSHEWGLFNASGRFDAANEAMCKRVGNKLAQTYPGHPFGVIAEVEHGIVKVCLQGFTQWPYVIKVDTLKGDPSLRSVVKAGGELLERLKMPRKGFSFADWRAANAAMPYHFNRNRKAPE
jgi:hypothetical protein